LEAAVTPPQPRLQVVDDGPSASRRVQLVGDHLVGEDLGEGAAVVVLRVVELAQQLQEGQVRGPDPASASVIWRPTGALTKKSTSCCNRSVLNSAPACTLLTAICAPLVARPMA
jgi:hypothetical protein